MRNTLIACAVTAGLALGGAAWAADATKDKKAAEKKVEAKAAPKAEPVAAPKVEAKAAPKPGDKAAEKGIILQKDAKGAKGAPGSEKAIILQKPADKKAPDAKAKTAS
jgi:hypothetical protein